MSKEVDPDRLGRAVSRILKVLDIDPDSNAFYFTRAEGNALRLTVDMQNGKGSKEIIIDDTTVTSVLEPSGTTDRNLSRKWG